MNITLTLGYTSLVDDNDYGWLKESFWRAVHPGNWYAARTIVGRKGTPIVEYMSRAIVAHHGHIFQSGDIVDHINHDTLDNRTSNLRVVDNKTNVSNRKGPQLGNTSGILGVRPHGPGWQSMIMINRKAILLGTYPNKLEAGRARNVYITTNTLPHTLSMIPGTSTPC